MNREGVLKTYKPYRCFECILRDSQKEMCLPAGRYLTTTDLKDRCPAYCPIEFQSPRARLIKPCPICGTKTNDYVANVTDNRVTHLCVVCNTCNTQFNISSDTEDCIEKWNSRKGD